MRLRSAAAIAATLSTLIAASPARAITKAHEAGIVHRDLKPDNIFLVRNDDEELARALDLGIAKITHGLAESAQKLSTQTGALLGTPFYMSPEQVRGHAIASAPPTAEPHASAHAPGTTTASAPKPLRPALPKATATVSAPPAPTTPPSPPPERDPLAF